MALHGVMSLMNRTYLDTETSGLDPYTHEILEVAFVVEQLPTDPNGVGEITKIWESKIKPHHIRAAQAKALEVNGYNPDDWKDAPYFEDVADEIKEILSEASVLVGHNPNFDTGFLTAAFRREGMNPYIPYHKIDSVTSAYEAWGWDGSGQKLSLDNLRDLLGIPRKKSHSALIDTLDCRRVLYAARSKLTGIVYNLDALTDGEKALLKQHNLLPTGE